MDRRSLRASVRAMLVAAVCSVAALPATASAQVTTDLNDWNLTESVSTWGGGTQFHISSGSDGWDAFRWLDSPSKTTVISANSCGDYSVLGSATIGVNDTAYKNLFWGVAGTCFVMRGRTAAGSGSMLNHDGRVKR
jgi:opacity protein-like surface antigen